MEIQITPRTSPDQIELARKREELARLQSELADSELLLANVHAELSMFEGRYLRQVGTLYAELDAWNAKIADLAAMQDGTDEATSAAAQARTQAEESYAAAHGEAAAAPDFAPSPEMKSLFRDVAKRVHPDLASGEADKAIRERLMGEANRAYRRGDADDLRRILEEYNSSPEAVQGTGVAPDLVRVLRQIDRIHKRLERIRVEVSTLISSDLSKLMAKIETTRTPGKDLLAEMAADVRKQILARRSRYEALASAEART